MSNHLAKANSPYLLQHADNPVDWYPWGPEALEKALRLNKPIFLSIGYAACHWCHVMAHESFEDPQTADYMNEHFVNIKVDREERPDLDSIYMNAIVSLTGQGGWPLSVFLTPDQMPFFGGTYFPPARRYSMPSFREVLVSVTNAWERNRDEILQSSQQIADQLAQQSRSVTGESLVAQPLQPVLLEQAAQTLLRSYDRLHGGWGSAPRFPQPMTIEFLLRRSLQGDQPVLEAAAHVLEAMSRGGMYDVVGGGFARYSTDDDWLVPHFEKMLYDNAQLARVYLHAYLLNHRDAFRRVTEDTLDFILREMTDAQGGFFSSLDADSDGQEGRYYIWSLEEIQEAIQEPQDLEIFLSAYEVTGDGNFEGGNVLQRKRDDAGLALDFNKSEDEIVEWLRRLHKILLQRRNKRIRPGTDDKVLTSWNALALAAFAEAARYLHRPDYLQAAQVNARFILTNLFVDGRLLRSWRKGRAGQAAFLEDYAALIQALLALYQTDPEPYWFTSAISLVDLMIAHYRDPGGGFFDTSDEQVPLLIKPKELQDNATPSGNSLAAGALLLSSSYTANGGWRDTAEQMIGFIQALAARYPTAFAGWLQDLDFAASPVYEVAILGDLSDPRTQALSNTLWDTYRPNLVAATAPYPPAPGSPPLLDDRPQLSGLPTAYLCQRFVCQKPVNDPLDLKQQLPRQFGLVDN